MKNNYLLYLAVSLIAPVVFSCTKPEDELDEELLELEELDEEDELELEELEDELEELEEPLDDG